MKRLGLILFVEVLVTSVGVAGAQPTKLEGPGGALVLLEESHDVPLVTVDLTFKTGSAADPERKEGLCKLASELMRRGAGGRTRAQLDAAFDALGASFEVGVDHDSVSFGGTVLARNLGAYLELAGLVLAHPGLAPAELARLKREALSDLDDLRDNDRALVRRYFDREVFGKQPYGRSMYGTPGSLKAVSMADVRAWVARWITTRDLIIGLAGDLTADQARAAAAGFAALPDRAPPELTLPEPVAPAGRRIVIVDKPERTQSQIMIGHPGLRWARLDDFAPLEAVATAFGDMFTSRLMTEVRVKRGWSYGATARVERGRGAGSFFMHVYPSEEQTADTLELVLRLYDELGAAGITAAELDFAKSFMTGNYAFDIDTPEKRLELRLDAEVAGVGADFLERWPGLVSGVTSAAAARVVAAYLHPKDLVIVIVGTAKQLRPALGRLGIPITVKKYDSY